VHLFVKLWFRIVVLAILSDTSVEVSVYWLCSILIIFFHTISWQPRAFGT